MGGGGNGKRGEIPERGQILHFPGNRRARPALGRVVPAASVGAEGCADPFGGGRSPLEGEFRVSTGDAIYLSAMALLAVGLAYYAVRFWFGE